MKKISNWFLILAALLSNVMSAVVVYWYCNLQWGSRYAGYSASTYTAFFFAIPYLVGVVVCIAVAIGLKRKGR